MKSQDTVHGLKKGLAVLEALNHAFDMSALELSRATGIPRPTIHRLLNTLMREDYIKPSLRNGRYRVTSATLRLSSGFRDASRLTDVASRHLKTLSHEIGWASDIASYEDGAMVIRCTTNNISPLATVEPWVGGRVPVLTSALGLAYLAHTAPKLQAAIISVLSPSDGGGSEGMRSRHLEVMLGKVAAQGYAVRVGGVLPGTFSIAIPIHHDSTVIAAMNVICLRGALKADDGVRLYLDSLRATARTIEAELAEHLAL